MGRMRWLLIASLMVASGMGLLAGPMPVAAEGKGHSPIVRFTGVVEHFPGNEGDPWLIDGRELQVVEGTNVVEASGPIEAGSEVFVIARQTGDEGLEAILIRPQPMGHLRRVQAALDRAWALLNRFAMRWRFAIQTRYRTPAEADAQDETCTQNQTRTHDQTRTQDQIRTQDQTCTQDQTRAQDQTRTQDQTCTQDGAQSQSRTRAGAGGR